VLLPINEKLKSISPPWSSKSASSNCSSYGSERMNIMKTVIQNTCFKRRIFKNYRKSIQLQWFKSAANFVLCYLPEDGPNAEMIVAKCKRTDLYQRCSQHGKSFNKHTIRIAIKRNKSKDAEDLEQRFRSLTKTLKLTQLRKVCALSSFF
jgi:histidinol-phosphate/aromatic aminotransferase/cobyric acid decarboxylase-like protein